MKVRWKSIGSVLPGDEIQEKTDPVYGCFRQMKNNYRTSTLHLEFNVPNNVLGISKADTNKDFTVIIINYSQQSII